MPSSNYILAEEQVKVKQNQTDKYTLKIAQKNKFKKIVVFS